MTTRRQFLNSGTYLTALSILPLSACAGGAKCTVQANLYDCEGCEATSEVDTARLPNASETADHSEPGERLILRGQVLSAQSHAPMPGVVIYLHQTNTNDLYA